MELTLPLFLSNQIMIIFREAIVKTPCPENLIKKNNNVMSPKGTIQEFVCNIALMPSLISTETEQSNNDIPNNRDAKKATYRAP